MRFDFCLAGTGGTNLGCTVRLRRKPRKPRNCCRQGRSDSRARVNYRRSDWRRVPCSEGRGDYSVLQRQHDLCNQTNNRGEYAVSLAATRKYHVVVEGFGACNLSRAAFSMARNQRVVLNFIGVACPFIDTDAIPLPSELPAPIGPEHHSPCMTTEVRPFWYREQTMAAGTSIQRPEVVISYGSCKQDQLGIAYASLDPYSLLSQRKRSGPGLALLQVTITSGTYTIRADQVIFHRQGMTFTAAGNVLVEDGTGKISHFDAATLSFVKGIPIITPVTSLPISAK